MRVKEYLILTAVIITACLVCFASGYKSGRRAQGGTRNDRADTLVVYRTKTITEPQFKAQTLQRWAFFTEEKHDTIEHSVLVPYAVHDTVFVPIVQRYYEELDGRLRMWISGYEPRLDRFELDEKESIITKRKHWGISAGFGPALIYTPFHDLHFDAGIGIFGGVTYTF